MTDNPVTLISQWTALLFRADTAARRFEGRWTIDHQSVLESLREFESIGQAAAELRRDNEDCSEPLSTADEGKSKHFHRVPVMEDRTNPPTGWSIFFRDDALLWFYAVDGSTHRLGDFQNRKYAIDACWAIRDAAGSAPQNAREE